MKLAMAVGKNRHYIIDQIQPRHFVESAMRAGVPASTVHGIFKEIAEEADRAIETATTGLPRGFPKPLVASIVGGLRKRLPLVERAAAGI
jgi:serine/threonine-protein kinase HipA